MILTQINKSNNKPKLDMWSDEVDPEDIWELKKKFEERKRELEQKYSGENVPVELEDDEYNRQ